MNHRDEAFLRVGDRSKKLTFDERMELMYSKGMRFYEDEPVYRSTLDDIDMEFVAKHQNEALDEALETKIVMLMKTNSKIKQTGIII